MLFALKAVACAAAVATAPPGAPCKADRCTVNLPAGSPGIGFDDLHFAPMLGKVLVPAGRTGRLDLLEPGSLQVVSIGGFSTDAKYGGGHDQSVTSADEGAGLLFATDRDTRQVSVVDPRAKRIVASVKLAGGPDYVRYVAATGEVWVTEPDAEQIEILKLTVKPKPVLVHAANLPIPGGPESLIIDPESGRAFTHLWHGKTVAIDVRTRAVGPAWTNGCSGSRGIAIDPAKGWIIAGCAEGKASILDWKSGAILSTASAGAGVDVIDYDPKLRHVYLAGARSKTLEILGATSAGKLSVLGSSPAEAGSHCVATDRRGWAYVCMPSQAQILAVHDALPVLP